MGLAVDKVKPTAMQVEFVGQETPSRPTAVEGTLDSVQVRPPSLVVRRPWTPPPRGSIPPPATTHLEILTHEIAFKKFVSGGTAS
jgi:hypothetical protein